MNELFEPVPNIFPREIEHEPIRKELASYAEALDKLVAIGTHLLKWERRDTSRALDETGTVAVFFRRILELVDSIAVLIKVGSVDPAVNQIRALLELVLAFEFLLKDDTQRRCYCYLITDFYRRKLLLQNPEISDLASDLDKHIMGLDQLIDLPNLAEAKTEYLNKMRGNPDGTVKFKEIKWYNLFTTINNLSDLAKELNKFKLYSVVYKISSNATHGTDLVFGNIVDDEGVPALLQIRNSSEAIEVVKMTFSLVEVAFNCINKRRTLVQKQEYIWSIQICKKQHQKVALPHLYRH